MTYRSIFHLKILYELTLKSISYVFLMLSLLNYHIFADHLHILADAGSVELKHVN